MILTLITSSKKKFIGFLLVVFVFFGCRTPHTGVLPSSDPWVSIPQAKMIAEWYDSFELHNITIPPVLPCVIPKTLPAQLFRTEDARDRLTRNYNEDQDCSDKIAEVFRGITEPFVQNPGDDHGRDIVSDVADMENGRKIQKDSPFLYLLDHAIYRKNGRSVTGRDLPASLVNVIQGEFETLLRTLTESERGRVSGVTLVFNPPGNSGGIWLGIDSVSEGIRISPALIRAEFEFVANKHSGALKNIQEGLGGDDVQSRNRAIHSTRELGRHLREKSKTTTDCFSRSFSYAIASQLANRYLAGQPEDDIESAVIRHLRRTYGDHWLGALDTIIRRAIEERISDSLSIQFPEEVSLLVERFSRYERLSHGDSAAEGKTKAINSKCGYVARAK